MLKEEFSPDEPWFLEISVVADLGYQGIKTTYQGDQISIPHKKPRKSQANPNPQLSQEQIEENRALSKRRIFVENAICGIKRYNILNHPFRNRLNSFDDQVIGMCAGLWNFLLA